MTDGYKICVFNVHAREVEENNRMPLGPKNSEGISDTHEKSQWTNLRISAGMGMGDKDGWSEMASAHCTHWALGNLTANQRKFLSWK